MDKGRHEYVQPKFKSQCIMLKTRKLKYVCICFHLIDSYHSCIQQRFKVHISYKKKHESNRLQNLLNLWCNASWYRILLLCQLSWGFINNAWHCVVLCAYHVLSTLLSTFHLFIFVSIPECRCCYLHIFSQGENHDIQRGKSVPNVSQTGKGRVKFWAQVLWFKATRLPTSVL